MNDSSELDDEKVASLLKGNTLRVYWVFFRSEDGVGGLERFRETSSYPVQPSLARLFKIIIETKAKRRVKPKPDISIT
jgi:hypothetical protein